MSQALLRLNVALCMFASVNNIHSKHVALLGWWELVSCEVEFQASAERVLMYDTPAHGFLVFEPGGRMMALVEARYSDARAPRGMAYTGRYRVNGNQWLTDVDAACGMEWTGSIQERFFEIESDRLHVCSAWCVSRHHGGETVRAWLVWKRMTGPA